MNCRVMSREEFIARMLADQELRRRKQKEDYYNAVYYFHRRRYKSQSRYLRDKKRGR